MGVQKSKKSKKFTKYSKNSLEFNNKIKYHLLSINLRKSARRVNTLLSTKSIALL